MYRDKRIALVIPAFNESRLIGPTLESTPALIDHIVVVDDASTDDMAAQVEARAARDPRVALVRHTTNQGPGSAIITGYRHALQRDADIVVVCGGDHQMPLEQTPQLLDPLIDGRADYAKGNRFMHGDGMLPFVPETMPTTRVIGNVMITALTKIASGYFKVADVVEGFTAITRAAIERVDWNRAWGGYGYPMDFLIRLNAHGLRVVDVPRRAIYLPGERQSQIKGLRYAMKVSPMLLRGFVWRLWYKYVLRDFHPLVLFYFAGLWLLPLGVLFGLYLCWEQWIGAGVSGPRAVLCALLIITGLQFLLFAMLFDMQESG